MVLEISESNRSISFWQSIKNCDQLEILAHTFHPSVNQYSRNRCLAYLVKAVISKQQYSRAEQKSDPASPSAHNTHPFCKHTFLFVANLCANVPRHLWASVRVVTKCSKQIGISWCFLWRAICWSTFSLLLHRMSITRVIFLDVFGHLFHKFLWAGGLNYSCHPFQARFVSVYVVCNSSFYIPSRPDKMWHLFTSSKIHNSLS